MNPKLHRSPTLSLSLNPRWMRMAFRSTLTGWRKCDRLAARRARMLVRDPVTGKQYVMKRGASADHVRREVVADDTYRALGVRVPVAEAV